MGNQQMLLTVLVVIMVLIAIGLGISYFFFHEYQTNKKMLVTEMNTYPPVAVKFFNTNKIMGGAHGDENNVTREKVAAYLGFSGPNYSQTSENGEFRVMRVNGPIVTIKALGKAVRNGKRPMVEARVNVAQDQVTVTLGDAAGW